MVFLDLISKAFQFTRSENECWTVDTALRKLNRRTSQAIMKHLSEHNQRLAK
jgi:hypothetical protein